eukprot:CAMPEP_0198113730 /NCGR_PEP_ID=MMETSP1442-20131203/5329_1 /TAXON_ID= /ORGANISM="Craspedostauros australis, Strain CCMP3328" /LENGTH=335 /DNA_ID=CAMNT_0043770901 /DNA_START=216 /DNA_END=1223 /DNA_ORIENTATION=+
MAFNKMFVMLPMMLAARKIDGEDPVMVYWLRVAYGVIQTICVLLVIYTYILASNQAGQHKQMIYVPPAATPFADPNAKKKYTQVAYSAHVLTTARSLVGSTLFGVAMTVGLHLYKGMVVGLAMQTVMAPLNLIENALVKAVIFGGGFKPEDKIFEEKASSELTDEDEIVDDSGNPVVKEIGTNKTKTFEDLLLDTWDAGAKADIGPLMAAITKKNCNFSTKENGWTPLMVLGGLSVKGVGSAIRQIKELGGNPAITDGDGWNAMHWAAFHGSPESAKELVKDPSLLTVKDKEGKTPIEMAKAENNKDVSSILEDTAATTDASEKTKADTGLRKRK